MTLSCRSVVACLLGFSSIAGAVLAQQGGATAQPSPPGGQQVTFNRDIAPILFHYCAACHHTGEAGPFPLLTYADAKARARQIAAVTSKRFMPPWLPAPQELKFADELRLSDGQIAVIQEWVERRSRAQPPIFPPPRNSSPGGSLVSRIKLSK
ncbi:MAG: hypothetical protein AUH86_00820 [Acidobacteria bacterium 13_1_40CM_4_58_4]|nr:MAG: hypothetical protein AUH86_00820 [Acidobacteria bacterium 13_1_40CM_4_58_4]